MEYRRLGKSGLQVSALSFGAWVTFGRQISEEVARELMHAAYNRGVNFFDNAEAYAAGTAEEVMGRILASSGWRRDTYVVSSKVFFGGVEDPGPNQRGLSRKHIFEACDAACQRLQVEYLDLYFCHRHDPETPVEEVVRAMTDLIRMGKVLYWGTSEWNAQQLQEAVTVAQREHLVPPTMEQPQYNMMHRQKVESDFRPLYEQIGLGTTIWSPLASGLLTGKYLDGIPEGSRFSLDSMGWLRDGVLGDGKEELFAKLRELKKIADELGISMARLALAWCLGNPHVSTVITGASRVEQVEENMKAMDDLPKVTPEVRERIETILDNKPDGSVLS